MDILQKMERGSKHKEVAPTSPFCLTGSCTVKPLHKGHFRESRFTPLYCTAGLLCDDKLPFQCKKSAFCSIGSISSP